MAYEDRLSIDTPEGVTLDLTLAGLGSRFIAALIDTLIQWAIILAIVLGLGALGGDGDASGGESVALAIAVAAVFVFGIQWGYDVLFETLASGRTPGKRATGLRVVRDNGAPVGFMAAAVRNLVRLVDLLPGMYAVGIIAILASRRNQRLGDMAAGTLVVRERRGGRRQAPVAWTAWAGVDPAVGDPEWMLWDVSAVTAGELTTVRSFLARRASLTDDARARIGADLAARLRPKVAGAPPDVPPERFLAAVAAAKSARS